ncbi:MAG: hypothetical protein AAFU38_08665 [Bacteroidota bacterium]
MSKIILHHTEADLDDVIAFWVKEYKIKTGLVVGHDSWVDVGKRKVMIRLSVEVPGELDTKTD